MTAAIGERALPGLKHRSMNTYFDAIFLSAFLNKWRFIAVIFLVCCLFIISETRALTNAVA